MSQQAQAPVSPVSPVTYSLRTVLTDAGVRFDVVQKGGLKDGEVLDSETFVLAALPATLKARGGRAISVAAYGLAVLLRNRTSDVNKKGAAAVLAAMRSYFGIFQKGEWREYAEARSPFDPLLPDAIIRAYSYPPAARARVVERLRAKTAEEVAALEKEHADLLSKLRAESDEGDAVDF